MIETTQLTFAYPNGKTFQFSDISCHEQEDLLILGQSGSGKTTLLHLLGLLHKPHTGRIKIDGTDTQLLTPQELVQFRAQKVGMIFQKAHFVHSLSVLDNLLVANYFANQKVSLERANYLAEELAIQDLLKKKVTTLSGGEQQRVCIARALMNDPKVIFLDEPVGKDEWDQIRQDIVGLWQMDAPGWLALVACVAVTAGLRALALWRNWQLPAWRI